MAREIKVIQIDEQVNGLELEHGNGEVKESKTARELEPESESGFGFGSRSRNAPSRYPRLPHHIIFGNIKTA